MKLGGGIESLLFPGETLVWVGRPLPDRAPARRNVLGVAAILVLASLAILAGYISWNIPAVAKMPAEQRQGLSVLAALLVAYFSLKGLCELRTKAQRHKRIRYAISERRAFIEKDGCFRTVRTMNLEDSSPRVLPASGPGEELELRRGEISGYEPDEKEVPFSFGHLASADDPMRIVVRQLEKKTIALGSGTPRLEEAKNQTSGAS